MRIECISVQNFLGVSAAAVSTDRPLTVVTGANGSGKSTLLHALRLMLDAIKGVTGDVLTTLDKDWAAAGRFGARSFEVRIKITFDHAE